MHLSQLSDCKVLVEVSVSRIFFSLNKAFLAKQAWRLLYNLESLWARCLKAKYFPNYDLLQAIKGRSTSWCWNEILNGRELLIKKREMGDRKWQKYPYLER